MRRRPDIRACSLLIERGRRPIEPQRKRAMRVRREWTWMSIRLQCSAKEALGQASDR